MTYRDQTYDLAVQYDAHGFELAEAMKAHFDQDLELLATILHRGPAAALNVDLVHHPRTGDYHVKTSLRIGRGRAFFTGDRDPRPGPAFKRCVHKLIRKVEEFRRQMEKVRPNAAARGPHVAAEVEPDWAAIAQAAQDADYAAFRKAIAVYEDGLTQRIGRVIERFPEAAAALGDTLLISELVEEVFLNAFERFADGVRRKATMSTWLESLIEPSIRAVLEDPESERENVAFVRTLAE